MISLLLPTRGRSVLVARLFASIIATTSDLTQIEVVMYIDEDDNDSFELDSNDFKVKKIIGPKMSMGNYNTACMQVASGDIFILMNDDIVIRTYHWDERVRRIHNTFPDQIYLGYGNDLFKGARLCTFPILSRRTCQLLVDPFPKIYRRMFIDNHLFDIFKRLQQAGFARICYDAELVFEHLHHRTGKSPLDETYKQADQERFADDMNFISLIETRVISCQRLIAGIQRQPTPDLPVVQIVAKPATLPAAVICYLSCFMADSGIPWRYRFYLWYKFIGRYIASRGWLRPFVAP